MELEPCIVILLYPDCAITKTGRLFLNNCSMLSNATWCRNYVDNLYVGEGKPTCAKICVAHNILVAVFNSLNLAQKSDDLDGAVRACIIKASKVVEVEYLLGPSKTMEDTH